MKDATRNDPERPGPPSESGSSPLDSDPPVPEPDQREPPPRRRRALAAIVASALVVAGFGLLSPLWVKSPQQRAAEAGPPTASVLTAPVERRVVTQTLILRGQITPEQIIEVTPTAGGEATAPVVTDLGVEQGDEVAAGQVLLEVSGRPLVALPGDVPVYRDLRPGAEGADVAQLQRALRELGHTSSGPDGSFGPATKRAVESYYEALGYLAPTTGEGDEAAVAAAETEIRQLERQVEDAQAEMENAASAEQRSVARRQLDRAKEDLAIAETRLAELERRTGPMVPASEVVFLPDFPATVHTLAARVGAPPETPLIGLASGRLVVTAEVSSAQRELLKPGQLVEIYPEAADPATGSVTAIESDRPEPGADPGALTIERLLVTPEPALARALVGRSARLTVTVASSEDDELAVPVSALYAAHDGSVYVIAYAADNERRVPVTLGVSGDGYVAISPEPTGSSSEGDLVVVGAEAPPADSAEQP